MVKGVLLLVSLRSSLIMAVPTFPPGWKVVSDMKGML